MKKILFALVIAATAFTAVLSVIAEKAIAACPVNTANMGVVTGSFNIPTAGTYRVWSRIKPDGSVSSNNSYTLEVDGNQCGVTVGDATIPSSTWTWVDYKDGNTASKVEMNLTAGTHTFTMYGREAGVLVDKVVFSGNLNCVPSGNGDNCATEPSDTTTPTVSITSPSNNSTVNNTVAINANASDNVAVGSVSFYRNGTLIGSDNSSPYSVNWNTGGVSNGQYSLTAIATDTSGISATSSIVSVTVNNTVPDTTAPTTSITSPTNNAKVSGNVTINASASDNVGVTKVELLIDGNVVATDTTYPYSFSWNTNTYSNASHTLRTRAYDVAGNGPGQSTQITVTANNQTPTPKPGDTNNDGLVNVFDLSPILSNWGKSGRSRAQGDLNGDGTTNIFDLSQCLSNWGVGQ